MTDVDTTALDRALNDLHRLVRRIKDMPILLQSRMNRLAREPSLGFDIVLDFDGSRRAEPSETLTEFVAELRACKN